MSSDASNPRARKGKGFPHTPSEETELDGNLNFPHAPMHFHPNSEKSELDELEMATEEKDKGHGLEGDRYNIGLLTFLYVLQGIPLGLAGSIPYLLSSRNVSYKDQAMFSFVFWPFSVKLLWAPLVDSVYFRAFGRRKSWLVPVQYLIGFFMLILSGQVTELLGEGEEGGPVRIMPLTIVFFLLNFMAATQDIAVDGWALTMLQRRNVGWASTCNTVGQTAGYFLGYVVFLALESPDFCNNYLRSVPGDQGVVTFAGFLFFWGIVFLITTTLVTFAKKETDSSAGEGDNADRGIVETYLLLWKIIKLPAVMSLIGVLLTCKMGFAAADSVTGLKLIEEGVPKERLALLGIPMVPIQIILPLVISKYTTGPNPMNLFLKAMPYRLVMGIVFALIVWWAPSTKTADGVYPFYFYLVVLCSYAIHQVFLFCMFVAVMGFFARISDPVIGGTYMTLLNTISNLGGNWPSTIALWLVDGLTWRSCNGAPGECDSEATVQACKDGGGACVTTLDGYYIESLACVIIGFTWLILRSRKVRALQESSPSEWMCS